MPITKPTINQRYQLANTLGLHLADFSPDLKGKFQRPTCTKVLNIHLSSKDITAAHILPEAAGGKRWTLLCKQCNSSFGKSQDKWFGEYLNVLLDEKASFLDAKTKSKYIEVNGEKISGTITVPKQGPIEIFMPIDHNPPGKVKSIHLGSEVTIKFVPELVRHEMEISVGYLTAAYLMWFDALGYNWVYQSGLDVVREQILNPQKRVWKDFELIALDHHVHHELVEPWIGILIWKGNAYAASIIYDRVVIFPPPTGTKTPRFTRKSGEQKQTNIIKVDFRVLSDPYIVSYEDNIIVLPNMIRKEDSIPKYLLRIPADINQEPQWLTLMNDSE
jgi:hypothetical protein